jgi:hypothetical protein
MTDHAAPFQPGREPTPVPFRSRAEFAGYKAFGSGHGAVLMDVETERRLRSAAESATQRRRAAGGLLFGHGWTDDQGGYLVIGGFLEAGPEGSSGDRGPGQFTLPEAGLRALRADAARLYPASLEVGWWRTLAALGEFTPRDFRTQAELAGPDGVGLLVFGSGPHWGTAYLGPDGRAPDTAGTLVATTDTFITETGAFLEPLPDPEPDAGPAGPAGPELVDITAGEHLTQDPILEASDVTSVKRTGLTEAAAGLPLAQQAKRRSSRRALRRAAAPAGRRAPSSLRESPWARRVTGEVPDPVVPEDARLVVGALVVAAVVAAAIVGVLLHSLIAAVIIAVIALLVIFSGVWLSRHW